MRDMVDQIHQALWWCDVCRVLWQRTPRWSGSREPGRSQHPKQLPSRVMSGSLQWKQLPSRVMSGSLQWCEGFARRLEDPAVLAAWHLGGLQAVLPMYPDHVFRDGYMALVPRQTDDPEVTLSA